ncbi:MAG: ROK family protein [Planctomycetota bacterium]|nr:ROK family protein [Planctomycetota bacterium]
MFLGIEIGGTKLQLGIGSGDGTPLVQLERRAVDPAHGSAGICSHIQQVVPDLLQRFPVSGIAYGFGGPVDRRTGRITTSHQIDGWDDFPLVDWTQQTFDKPCLLYNDCDAATIAEARLGAGLAARLVYFVTVGTGVGGGLAIDGQLHAAHRPAVAEIGHLRPGLAATDPSDTVESLASGWGIVKAAQRRMAEPSYSAPAIDPQQPQLTPVSLWSICQGDPEQLTAQHVADAAEAGDPLAETIIAEAIRALGWAIAQVITLTAVELVIVSGGVSLMGETRFFAPLRREVSRYVFGPLQNAWQLVPAQWGEEVVVHGALALAAEAWNAGV